MSFGAYIEATYDSVKNVAIGAFSHPVNAAVGFGDKTIGLVYYGVNLAISEGLMGHDAMVGSRLSANRIYNILSYCSAHSKEFNAYYKAYSKAYPGFKSGSLLSGALNTSIIFNKVGGVSKSFSDLGKIEKFAIKQTAGQPMSKFAEYGYLIRADLYGKLSPDNKTALQQVAYILVTGESNLYMYRKLSVHFETGVSGMNFSLDILKGLAFIRSRG